MSDRAGPFGGAHPLARPRHRSAPLRAAPLSALQPRPGVSRKRDVHPRHTLFPGSAGDRAALLAGAPSPRFAPPHGELKTSSLFSFESKNLACRFAAILWCQLKKDRKSVV